MRPDKANAVFMRDNILMTQEGALVGRQAMACRRGEERYAAQALAELGVPIIRTISGTGIFEMACCLWIDAQTVIIGTGNRANEEGALQVEEVLRPMGVENVLYLQIPYGYAHIDSIISFLDEKTAIFDPVRIPWEIYFALSEKDFNLLEAPSQKETDHLALNMVALEPGKVVMAEGYPQTRNFLNKNGIHVIEINISELQKGWGSLHCMTAALKRK
jgi:N-dimethylarginine dimethylaminohydrolase